MLLESHLIEDRYILLISILENTINRNEKRDKIHLNLKNIKDILDILVCPKTGGKLRYDKKNQELISLKAKLAYPIKDDIPILLVKSKKAVK